jgi:hypothetical protein
VKFNLFKYILFKFNFLLDKRRKKRRRLRRRAKRRRRTSRRSRWTSFSRHSRVKISAYLSAI